MFDTSTSAKSRSTQTLILSLAIHVAIAFALLMVHFAVETAVLPARDARVRLVAPVASAPRIRRAIRTPPKAPAVHQAALPLPRLPALAPPVVRPQPALEAPPAIQPAAPKDIFAGIAPAARPISKPPVEVQTGGFSSVPAAAVHAAKAPLIAAAGFGDTGFMPSPQERRSSLVAAAGFGDTGVSSLAGSARAAVRSSGFGDAISAAPSARGARPAAPAVTVAQILEKPRPAYTEEARRLRIEGEVQLEILFGASGEISILRVVRGLGHGLDENAVQAARTIRYLPARKDGRPVDSTATVHIIFQLAS